MAIHDNQGNGINSNIN